MSFTFFFKKKKQYLFKDFVDIHNHLLPAIDDGSTSLTQSLKMLDLFSDLGVKKIITTPHIYKDLYPNNEHSINTAFKLLYNNSKNHPIDLIGYGAEYMVDEFFLEQIYAKKKQLSFLNKHILIEIPFFGQLKILNQALFTLQNQGYLPILAHPERYIAIQTIKDVQNIKHRGAKMQLNALSLIGYYGPLVQKKASLWLKKGIFDFIGTDAHNPHQLKKLVEIQLSKKELVAWNRVCEKQNEF